MKLTKTLISALFILSSVSTAAMAATLIPVVPYPGSVRTGIAGINDNDYIVGPWVDANGIEHGYFGPLSGNNYTRFDYTGHTAIGTEPRGINNNNLIVGWGPTDGSGGYVLGPQFEYNSNTGKMRTIERNGFPLDGVAQGINKSGLFAGDYLTQSIGGGAINHGYLGKGARWNQDVSIFDNAQNSARGVNDDGVVVGVFTGSDGYSHGYVLKNGVASQIDFPDPNEQKTALEGINDKGVAAGQWFDNMGGGPYSFKLDLKTNKYTSIEIPGSTYQQAWGVNNAGLIAVSSDAGSFIYCPTKPSDCPQSARAIEIPDGRTFVGPAPLFSTGTSSQVRR